jgi:hypothetical protein
MSAKKMTFKVALGIGVGGGTGVGGGAGVGVGVAAGTQPLATNATTVTRIISKNVVRFMFSSFCG